MLCLSFVTQQPEHCSQKIPKAKTLYVIGYSFPLTDLTTNFLLQESINPKTNIVIINKTNDIEAYKTRLQNQILPNHTNFDFTYLIVDESKEPLEEFVANNCDKYDKATI